MSNRSDSLISTTYVELSGPGSNDNKGVTPYFPKYQSRSRTTRYSLVSYTGHALRKSLWHRGVVANFLDCDIVENEFELQSHYYVHFQTNIVRKGVDPLIPPAMS